MNDLYQFWPGRNDRSFRFRSGRQAGAGGNNWVGRGRRGIGCIEVAISTFMMIAISSLALDSTLIIIASSLNDAACRDAARAAAQCNNSASALQAAQTQLAMHATDGYFVSQPQLTSTTSPDFVYQDFSGNPPQNTSPYVTVTTAVNVRVPCPIVFFGVGFNSQSSNNTMLFKRQYTFPIIKEKFYG